MNDNIERDEQHCNCNSDCKCQSSEIKNKTVDSDENSKNVNDEIKTLKDQVLRFAAELQNLKKRTEKEKNEISKFAISNFAKEVLTIRDNLQMALNNCTAGNEKIAEGIKMTLDSLDSTLAKYGVTMVASLNEKFDPNFHQAINEIDSEKPTGTIVAVMQEGFVICDRILRPALVTVSK